MSEKQNGSHHEPDDDIDPTWNPLMPRRLFDELSGEQQDKLLSSLNHVMRLRGEGEYSGPLTPASEIARLENILPGSAERILGAYEAREMHRKMIAERLLDWLEKRAEGELSRIEEEHDKAFQMARVIISASIKYERRGQAFAFSLCVCTLILAANLISAGQVAAGVALCLAQTAAMALVFVYAWRNSPRRSSRRHADKAAEAESGGADESKTQSAATS